MGESTQETVGGARLSEWLRQQMVERQISRDALAAATGVASGTISRIRVNDHVPGVGSIIALAEFFGDNPDSVLELAGVLRLGDMPEDIPLELRDLLRRYFKLDAEIRVGMLQQWMSLMAWAETLPPGSEPPQKS
jgi:transcriptional regulator with XRE-family HTH domain